ncbi:MAG: PD-(D/E)XK nuclease-like domain-containing protein [Bacteroidales bacterium]|nr:PD-(D/E)XK nuclease-like domain-containing protein [Bacteroidales bacterium]
MKKPDYILDIPAEQYHQDARDGKFLSSHMLGDFRKCPSLYHKKMTGLIPPSDSASFTFGRATHSLVLEGRAAFDAEFIVSDGPVNEKTGEAYGKATKAYKEWLASQKATVISSADFDVMSAVQRAVWSHSGAATILDQGFAEGTVRTTYCGEPCQIRMDWFDPERRIIADLKTCGDLDRLNYDIRDFGYVNQLAFYRDVLEEASGEKVDGVYIIGVEKKEPYRCGLWMITSAALDAASEQNKQAICTMSVCREGNIWPTGYEVTRVIDVPANN